jgi:hypothetical protein
MTQIGDTKVIVQSKDLRAVLRLVWRGCETHGGPLVVTVNNMPEFAIFPLRVFVPLVHEGRVLDFARGLYEPLVPDRSHPPEGYETSMPRIGPDALRRSFAEECRRMRGLMTPYLYTHYHQGVAVLFPVPFDGGMEFVDKLSRLWYPARYETEEGVVGWEAA